MPQQDHYVSQTYLRSFINEDGYLTPYYKHGEIVIGKPKSPKSVCKEEDGDLNSYFKDPRILDDYLKLFENDWTKHVSALGNLESDFDTKYGIAGYISFLRACTPTAKRLGQGILAETIQPVADKIISESVNDPDAPPEIKELYEKRGIDNFYKLEVDREYAHARAISGLVGAAHRLFCSDWLVLKNETGMPFVTSDNPAVLYHRPEFSNTASTFIPLAPNLAVLITPDPSKDAPTLEEMEKFTHENDRFADIKEEYVPKFNELVVKSAERLVLSSGAFDWLEEMVRENKSWRVQTVTNKIPLENGVLILHRQMAVNGKKA